jgi:hypothetical protein
MAGWAVIANELPMRELGVLTKVPRSNEQLAGTGSCNIAIDEGGINRL